MATEYSLLTWLGLSTAVTLSTSTDAVTLAAHGGPVGIAFRFHSSSTTLPSIGGVQVSTATTYYVSATSLAAGTFRISSLADGSDALDITAAGTAVKIVGEYWAARTVGQKARYGTAGSERVYGTIAAWETGVNAAKSLTKDIVLEYYDKFTDSTSLAAGLSGFKSITLHSKVDGARTPAFHGGTVGGGYANVYSNQFRNGVLILQPNVRVDGLEIRNTNVSGTTVSGVSGDGNAISAQIVNNILQGGYGVNISGPGHFTANNRIINCLTAGFLESNAANGLVAFNLVTGGPIGFSGANTTAFAHSNSSYIGNIAVGNTDNWGTRNTTAQASSRFVAEYNFGLTGDADVWDTTANNRTVATTDFVNYAGGDFHPALSTSPQVELITVADGDGLPRYDIADAVRPNYIDAVTDKADAGPFEFDHGNGLIPNFQDFTITGLISGSRVKVKKTSNGTVIHNAVVGATSLTISYNAGTAPTPVTIDIAKGAAAPYYYRYRTTGSISHMGASGVAVAQIADIAADTYPAGVATDWSVNTTTKAITHVSGSTVYTVQDLYSYLAAYYDHADRVDLDMPMYGTTSDIFGLQNGGTISDADMQYLKGGSIMDGTTLWANVYTVGTQAAATPIYLHLDGSPVTSFWPTGNIDVLVKLPSYTGSEVVDVRAHKYSDTYDHWQMTVAEGRNVAAIATADDPDNQTLEATVAGYSDITVTVNNPTGQQIDASDTPANYTTTINGAGRPIAQIYERLKYLTRQPSTYVSANAAYAEAKAAPYGTFAAGVFSGARGIWLENVASGDALNYILTDNAGTTHQAAAPPVQILVTNIAASTTTVIQIYDLTNSVQLAVATVTGSTYALTKTWTVDLDIRVRIMGFSGSTAYEFYEAQGVFTSTGMSLRAGQVADAVYNANGINGSAVTGVTINDGTLRVNVATGSISWPQLYAYETYWLSTLAGIVDEGRFAQAVDVANYLWFDFKLKNVTAPTVPLVVTGGYGKDGDTGTSLGMIDTTGGTIIMAPDHVVPYSSGAEATVAIVQAGLTAQGYSTSRAASLENLNDVLTESTFIALK